MFANLTRFRLNIGHATDTGRTRESNEDFYTNYLPGEGESRLAGLLLVSDGMGGERGGEQASRLAVEQVFEEVHRQTRRRRSDGAESLTPDLADLLRQAAQEASNEIFRQGQCDPTLDGMGSTLVAAAIRDTEVFIAHVGDSRCYRIRQDEIKCLTCDHIWHSQNHVLTRTLGDESTPEVDVRVESLEDGDLLLLCTDGLTNSLSDQEILRISKRFIDPQDLAEALVALAIDQDGTDNATAVVCRCDTWRDEDDPEDTEPIYRSGLMERSWPRKRWLAISVLVLFFLILVTFGPRILAIRAYERGIEHAKKRQYLHARQEFSTAIRWGLDHQRADQLIDQLLDFPSLSRAAEEVETATSAEER